MIDKDLIPQPHLWSMNLLIGPTSIEAVFFPPVASDDIIYRSIPLDPAAPSHLKAVEDAVYDNTLLLNIFRNSTIAVDTDTFTLLPAALGSDAKALAPRAIALATGLDEPEPNSILRAPGAHGDPALFFSVAPDLAGFLRRTFYNCTLTHPLAPMIDHFTSEGCSARPAIVASLRPGGRMDMIALDTDGKLLQANIFDYKEPDDAAFFILTSRAALPLPSSAPLFIAAPPAEREAIAAVIAAAAPDVSPAASLPYPAELWRSGSVLSSAPLPLLLNH